jgi:hypothetical protein
MCPGFCEQPEPAHLQSNGSGHLSLIVGLAMNDDGVLRASVIGKLATIRHAGGYIKRLNPVR